MTRPAWARTLTPRGWRYVIYATTATIGLIWFALTMLGVV
jgi:hypothetical protein